MTSTTARLERDEALPLRPNEIHVWQTELDLEPEELERLERTLSVDERARAMRFHFARDRQRFIAARGAVRSILGSYLGVDPRQIQFLYDRHGKPAVQGPVDDGNLRFNLSHSDGLALVATTRGRELGVDLERIRTDIDCDALAEKFFSPREVEVLRALAANQKYEAFFSCWTRKEAYVKARGVGLSLLLDGFDVSLAQGEPAAVLKTYDDPREASRWSLHELALRRGYAAALAVRERGWRLEGLKTTFTRRSSLLGLLTQSSAVSEDI
jgi:4'-phosphopantetheinyl transferase